MVKNVKRIIAVVLLLTLMSINNCFASVPVTDERTTVKNSLPNVTLYLDTDVDYNVSLDNTTVLINDSKTDIEYSDKFIESGEGVTYFILIDISKSIRTFDFQLIKDAVLYYSKMLDNKDRVYVIPFGESVYVEQEPYTPNSNELTDAVNSLELSDDYTQLYAALDTVVGMVEADSNKNLPERKIAMVFTDGVDDTNGGLITKDEAVKKMNDAGVPLYAFAVGSNKEGKDSLGVLARGINGCISDLDGDYISTITSFKNVVDNTLLIKAKVKNSEDILDYFTVRVLVDDKELIIKENIKAHKTEQSKDFVSVKFKKAFETYWWVIALLILALISIITLNSIKKNKGIINVDGKVVYESNIQKKYHVKVKEYNKKTLTLDISVNGGKTIEQSVELIQSLIIGRSNMCDLSFEDMNMSRQHFALEMQDNMIYIKDLNSTSGTYLNGVGIDEMQRVNDGDVINAGRTKIRIRFE